MISLIGFLLFLGLIIFGPRKTIEFSQEIGRLLAHVKHAAAQLQQSTNGSARPSVNSAAGTDVASVASSKPNG
jgi:Sec-independent protein translocase protein TatA